MRMYVNTIFVWDFKNCILIIGNWNWYPMPNVSCIHQRSCAAGLLKCLYMCTHFRTVIFKSLYGINFCDVESLMSLGTPNTCVRHSAPKILNVVTIKPSLSMPHACVRSLCCSHLGNVFDQQVWTYLVGWYSETCLIRSGLGPTCCGLIRQVAALHLTLVMWSVTCL